jgi:hypothetical protein
MLMVVLGIPRYVYMSFLWRYDKGMKARQKVMHVWVFVSMCTTSEAVTDGCLILSLKRMLFFPFRVNDF